MNTIGKEFIEKTKYKYLDISDQTKGYEPPPLEAGYHKSVAIIALPDPRTFKELKIGIREAVEKRTSIREYSKRPLNTDELSYLLWCTQGVKEIIPGVGTLRTVPSAGARHPLETYLLVNNIYQMRSGLYRFLALEHKLVQVEAISDVSNRMKKAFLDQEMVTDSAVMFIWVATIYRTTWRYSERGYRYIFLDAGHACPSSMRKCNTWRNGLMAGTLGGYEKKIQAHQT